MTNIFDYIKTNYNLNDCRLLYIYSNDEFLLQEYMSKYTLNFETLDVNDNLITNYYCVYTRDKSGLLSRKLDFNNLYFTYSYNKINNLNKIFTKMDDICVFNLDIFLRLQKLEKITQNDV